MRDPVRVRLQLFAQERTEPPTPRRRERARRKGQVARTAELTSALLLAGLFGALYFYGGTIGRSLARYTRWMYETWLLPGAGATDPENVHALFTGVSAFAATLLGPVLALAVGVAFLSQAAQVGLVASAEPLKPQLKRIDPVAGFKRIFSKRAFVELLKASVKFLIIGYLCYSLLQAHLPQLLILSEIPLADALNLTGRLVVQLALRVAVALGVLAALDYGYQRWEHEQSIRMTKQELKEELRETEGDPKVRAKIRQRQRRIASLRMMAQVPKADVVITNPVHLAVALAYDPDRMEAPQVVAKGAGPLARRIREIAQEHHVPVVENVWLARALYESTAINAPIPEELYRAVAEVLAFVYRLRQGRGRTAFARGSADA